MSWRDVRRLCATAARRDARPSFHFDYSVSPAAVNTGVMSTGMSFNRAVTDSISGVDTPYFASKRCARA